MLRLLPNMKADTIREATYDLFCTYGPPVELHADFGTQFVGSKMEDLLE